MTSPPAYALNRQDPIFDGLRADYPGFDEWLAKVARESDWDCCTVR
ncbi:hypothetical protein BN13_390034 [Nostocoides jenkinsii Ben 74]|uniref:Uncharacterized protein n=1 Tax=Nostocoides jenkinsii Ben 74 TaxID=1193518 RepID=A0A077MEN1_9MICO|nr:hypothetical protein BN13_390034 [Tetrasphaera jenkinsii Ben 74]